MGFFTRCSLLAIFCCTGIVADEGAALSEEKSSSNSDRPSVILSPSSHGGGDSSTSEKQRAHFAGARRPSAVGKFKKSSRSKKIKSPWFSSKTYPKAERKDDLSEETPFLPEDAPHFIRRSVMARDADKTAPAEGPIDD